MSYTYPEALNAMQKVAFDLLTASYPHERFDVRIVADAVTGTASVDWSRAPRTAAVANLSYAPVLRVTINMPVRPATYRMSADEFRRWAAYLLHEVGHPNDTDKNVWQVAVASRRHNLLNSVEDVRIEKRTIDRGIAHNAVAVLSDLVDMLHAKAVAGGYDPNSVASIGWTLSALGRAANGYAMDISDIHAKMDPNGTVGRIAAWAVPAIGQCNSTQDCLDLCDRIVDAVKVAQKAEPKRPEPQPEADVTLPDDLEGEADMDGGSSDEAGGDEQAPEQGGMMEDRADEVDPDAPEADEIEADEAGKGEGSSGGDGGKAGTPQSGDDAEAEAEKEFSDADIEAVDMQPTHEGNMVSTDANAVVQADIVRSLRNAEDQLRGTGVGTNRIVGRDTTGSVAHVTGNAAKMGQQRQLLARALKRNEQDEFEGGRTSGRLNTRALHKLVTGSETLFGKRHLSEGYDTDLQILLDGSSSMSGGYILAAATLALVAAQAAAQVGVSCTAHIFTTGGLTLITKGRERPNGKKFAYAYNVVGGTTPLTDSLILAGLLQAKRASGKRRILLVITDGGCDRGPAPVKAAAEYLERSMGTEIANLHIGAKPMGLFRNEVAVRVDDVTETGLRQLTQVMERGI